MGITDLKKVAVKLNKKKPKSVQGYSKLRAGDEEKMRNLIRVAESKMSPPVEAVEKEDDNSEQKQDDSSEEKQDDSSEEEDTYTNMGITDLKKVAVKLNKKKAKSVQGYSKLRAGDEEELRNLIRDAESKMSPPVEAEEDDNSEEDAVEEDEENEEKPSLINRALNQLNPFSSENTVKEEVSTVPGGELSEMLNNMTDDWASSDEELNFAMDSENEDMEFAASSAVDTDDSDFAESSDKKTSSDLEFAESSHTSSGLEFAASSAVDSDKSGDFAVSSSVETDSDLDFAESSGKASSGLDFAESSAVESD